LKEKKSVEGQECEEGAIEGEAKREQQEQRQQQ
jgi:hypothetical protein